MAEAERPSKTQRKKEMHELQALGVRLVALNPSQLREIGLTANLLAAVEDAKRFTRHEARRRQMQYIGRLMRGADAGAIREKLKIWDGLSHEHVALQKRVERWRDRLLEDENALGELAGERPGLDAPRLRSLIRKARDERAEGRPPHNYRELFRLLREVLAEGPTPDPGD